MKSQHLIALIKMAYDEPHFSIAQPDLANINKAS